MRQQKGGTLTTETFSNARRGKIRESKRREKIGNIKQEADVKKEKDKKEKIMLRSEG